MEPVIELTEADKLRMGGGRIIYKHPLRQDLIIKLHRPLRPKPLQGLRRASRRLSRRYGVIKNTMVEVDEIAAMVARCDQSPDFVAQFRGFAQTSLGVGALFDAVRGADGALAPTLRDDAQARGYDPDVAAGIDLLWDRIAAARAVVSDPGLANVVIASDGTLILVDGLGERTLIPVLTYSNRAYRAFAARHRTQMQRAYREACDAGGGSVSRDI